MMENKREAVFRKLNPYVMGAFSLAVLVIGFRFVYLRDSYSSVLTFLSLLFLLIPSIFYRLCRMRPIYQLNFLVYIFSFVAYTFGTAMRGYNNFPGLDKAMHTLSGVLFTFVGLLLFYILKPGRQFDQRDFGQASVFSISFSMLIAVFWEIIEFVINFILHNDPQRVRATGVTDTMMDIIVCLAGSLIFWFSMCLYYKKDIKLLLTGIIDTYVKRHSAQS